MSLVWLGFDIIFVCGVRSHWLFARGSIFQVGIIAEFADGLKTSLLGRLLHILLAPIVQFLEREANRILQKIWFKHVSASVPNPSQPSLMCMWFKLTIAIPAAQASLLHPALRAPGAEHLTKQAMAERVPIQGNRRLVPVSSESHRARRASHQIRIREDRTRRQHCGC